MNAFLQLYFTILVLCSTIEALELRNAPNLLRSDVSRRSFAIGIASACALPFNTPSLAAETIGKDPRCDDSTCLGVWDGLLADCPHDKIRGWGAGCTSSQDDTPGVFAEPWDYSETETLDWEFHMKRLIPALELVSSKRGDKVDVMLQEGRYLRVVFTDAKSGESSIGEFYFTPDDTTVQFRIGPDPSLSRGSNAFSSSYRNIERAEDIRKQLQLLKLPVLRNRRRALFFVESDLDTFGPGSAALGPPAEMRTGELEGRQDVDPRKKLDLVQTFPF